VIDFEKLPRVTTFKVIGFEEIAKSNNFLKCLVLKKLPKVIAFNMASSRATK